MFSTAPTKYWCRAFFVALVVIGVALVGVFALAGWGALTAAAGVFVVASSVLAARADRGTVAPFLYRLFVEVTGGAGRIVRGLTQVACFIVVATAGVAGTAVEVARPARRSMWLPKHSMKPDAYSAPYVDGGPAPRAGWIRGYIAWARRSRNRWALALLPFLILQRSGQEPDDSEVRGEIYTLY